MKLEPETPPQPFAQTQAWVRLEKAKPLVVLRDTERSLRLKTLETVIPLLPVTLSTTLEEASMVANDSLDRLAAIDLDEISDAELRPARIQMGLLFVGFGALALAFLLLYLYALTPGLNPVEQVRRYWFPYIAFVSMGVAGMFMLGREAMRPF
jgi:hypothetical protein